MDLQRTVADIRPLARPSPLAGYEYVRGYGVYCLPFDSGHVLALRVFPENDFAPYRTVWHRTPDGVWRIYADAPRLDIACPRYYSGATESCSHARIGLDWTGPTTLRIHMDEPPLRWEVSMTTDPVGTAVNTISRALPERVWRAAPALRSFEHLGRTVLGLGDVTLSGNAPNGHFAIVMPQRMCWIDTASAQLAGTDLGRPARMEPNPAMGALRLPARPVFAIGRAYFEMQDPEEYRRTVAELRSGSHTRTGPA